MVIFGASDGAIPYLLKHVLDDVFGAGSREMLWFLVGAILGLAVIRSIFGFIQRYFAEAVGLKIIRDLRDDISAHLLKLGPDFYNANTTGNLISRMTNDTLLVRQALTDASVTLIRDSIRIIALTITAFVLDPVLATIAFVGVPLGIYPIIRFGKRVKKLSRVGQDQLGGLTTTLHEIILGHKVIQAFSREKEELTRFKDENEITTKTYIKAGKYSALSRPTNEFLGSLAVAGVIIYGGVSVIDGIRTQGDFIAFLTAMFLLYEPLKKIGRVHNAIQTGISAAERVFEIVDTPPSIINAENAKELVLTKGHIVYDNVSFAYENDEPVLHNINLTIEPGESLALVGMSGGGKSTIVNLLPRFYDPTVGSITIDNQNLKDVTLESLRKNIAIVSQHTFLFNDTVLYNIGYGLPNATEEKIIETAKAAYAHEFISKLPNSYQTIIGEQGLRLSGGERARIAIARALLRDAPILVLDEATASLDSEAEDLVQKAIELLMKGRTVLVIAHRLATIRNASRIAAVVNGRVVETGSHEELLQLNGEYAKLYRLQFGETQTRTRVGEI